MITELKTKDLLDLINRLYERERNKLTLYGVSLWGIILAIIGLVGYINTDRKSISDYSTLIYAFTLINNFFLFIIDIINSGTRREKVRKLQHFSRNDIKTKFDSFFYFEFILMIIGTFSNWYSYYNSHLIVRYILLYFAIRMTWKVLSAAIFFLYLRKLTHFQSKLDKVKIGKLPLASGVINITLNLLVTFIFIKNNPSFIDDKSVLIGLYLVVIEMLLEISVVRFFRKKIKLNWLEQLEKKIIIDNLEDNKILDILKEEYFPYSDLDEL